MNVNCEVLCDNCRNCELFEIEQRNIWANYELYDRICSCKHIKICLNAVDVWSHKEETGEKE